MDAERVVAAALAGDRRALARLLTIVEADGADLHVVAPSVFAAARSSHSIGLTGAPGAGKSTLTDALIAEIRRSGQRVAVVAVDPSSPLTGGAILGDRVRLREGHARDPDVFVRSLASRGELGGLALAVPEVVRVFDACGWPQVVLETVGVGQSEVDIAAQADTTVVVVNPGWGDEVQANKAGLLEVADVLVVNKADRPGADATVRDLQRMLHLDAPRAWSAPVVTTVATDGTGAAALWHTIGEHQRHLASSGDLERRRAARRVAEAQARARHLVLVAAAAAPQRPAGRSVVDALAGGEIDPVSAGSALAALVTGGDAQRAPSTRSTAIDA